MVLHLGEREPILLEEKSTLYYTSLKFCNKQSSYFRCLFCPIILLITKSRTILCI